MKRAMLVLLSRAVASLPAAFDSKPAAFDARYAELANKTYRQALAGALADAVGPTNPRFDRERFIAACGGGR